MQIKFSSKAESFKPNIFNILDDKKKELVAQGKRVFNFSVGTPDFPPDKFVMEAVSKAALQPESYKYTLGDIPELTDAVKTWYKRRYNVTLESNEIMGVYGSQEGIAHIGLALCDAGDTVLVPDPCYPIFEIGPYLNGAKIEHYRLNPDNGYLPELDEIPQEVLLRTKFMVVSYPLNPVCATAPDEFYIKLIDFAKKNNIVIIHDNAYSEIVYDNDGKGSGSFLSFPGAKEVGAEFNSLSKTYNLSGLRVSFLLGNSEIIRKFRAVRTQIDYGNSYLSQLAAVTALNGPQDIVERQRAEYLRRMKALCGGFRSIGWNVPDSKGSMFVWAPIPSGFADSDEFCIAMLERTGVICTPGSSFGASGSDHVRFALVLDTETIAKAVKIIDESGIIGG